VLVDREKVQLECASNPLCDRLHVRLRALDGAGHEEQAVLVVLVARDVPLEGGLVQHHPGQVERLFFGGGGAFAATKEKS